MEVISLTEIQTENLENDTMQIVQMSIRLPKSLMEDLKIYAIQNDEKINDLLVKYIQEGFNKDKQHSE